MQYDELRIKIAKDRFSDRKLTTETMINILSMFVESSTCLDLSVNLLLCDNEGLLEKYRDYLDKRFDFVDLKNKRIYKLEDNPNFKFASLFDLDYAPCEKQTYDAFKLQIIVDAGYDLVQVTHDTLCNEFIDTLINKDFISGSSYVISGENVTVTSTESMTDEVTHLRQIIDRLLAENEELKKQLSSVKKLN